MHNLCSMHALDRVRFCISRFCRRSGDHGAIREGGRFGSIWMVWIQNTDVSPGKSGSMMSLTSYWRNGAPVLVVMTSRASSPCLNCMGWQDMSLTVAKEDRASSPYLNCIGRQDKSSSRWSFPMSGGMASSPYLNCVGWQDKLTVEVKNHNALWSASETSHHSNATELTSFSYCFVMVAWSIESRKTKKIVIVGEVGFQVPSYYDTVLYNNSRLL